MTGVIFVRIVDDHDSQVIVIIKTDYRAACVRPGRVDLQRLLVGSGDVHHRAGRRR